MTNDLEVRNIEEVVNHRGQALEAGSVYMTLINKALTERGTINKAFSLFHNYSVGNSLLAYFQLQAKGLDVTPLGTYNKWKSLGHQVAKGSKAIAILFPVFGTYFTDEEVKDNDGNTTKKREKRSYIKGFQVHHEHFAYSQCKDYKEEVEQRVDLNIDWAKVLETLKIKQVQWDTIEGNAQGYARPMLRELAINPLCTSKDKTMVHEIAHVLLHGKDEEFIDNIILERDIKEVQAELVAYLVISMLGVTDEEVMAESRGYIQAWLGLNQIGSSEIKQVMRASDRILEAITGKKRKNGRED